MSKLVLFISKTLTYCKKKVSGTKHVFIFYLTIFVPTNFRRADIRALPAAVVRFEQTLEWLDKFRKNSSIQNFTKIRTTILKLIRTGKSRLPDKILQLNCESAIRSKSRMQMALTTLL